MKRLKYVLIQILIVDLVYSQEIEYYPSQSVLDGKTHRVISKRDLQSNVITNAKESNAKGTELTSRHFNEQKDMKAPLILRQFDVQDATGNLPKIKNFAKKRSADPVFHGHPKTREELWNEHFLAASNDFDQTPSLVKLIHNITLTYLHDCTPVILYDSQVKSKASYLFQDLLKEFPVTFIHGYIDEKDQLAEPKLLKGTSECFHFIIFFHEVRTTAKVLGKQSDSKVVIVARSSQWAVQEFLAGPLSRMFINLLVIGQSFKEDGDSTLVRSDS